MGVSKDYETLEIFISAKSTLEDERETAARIVEDLGFKVKKVDKAYPPTRNSKVWVTQAEKSDIIILILDTSDELSEYVKEEIEAALKEGKSILFFKKANKGEEVKTEEEVKKFVKKLYKYCYGSYFSNCVELMDKIKQGLMKDIKRVYTKSGEVIIRSDELFNRSCELVKKSISRLFLILRTPPIFIEPRSDDRKDKEFKEILNKKIEEISKSNSEFEFKLFYVVPRVVEELKRIEPNRDINEKIYNFIVKLREYMDKIEIYSIKEDVEPLVISDDKILFYVATKKSIEGRGGRDGYGILIEDSKLAKDLMRSLKTMLLEDKSIEDMEQELREFCNI